MADLTDVQVERFVNLGVGATSSTNTSASAVSAAASFAATPNANPYQVAYSFGSTTAAAAPGLTPYGTTMGTTSSTDSSGVTTTTVTYSNGMGGSFTSSTTSTATTSSSTSLTSTQQDAWSVVTAAISSWFGNDPTMTAAASAWIKQEMLNNVGPQQALVDMRQQSFYQQRFAGNATRVAAGLNALSEAEYVSLENNYADTMKQYGVGEGSATNLATKAQFATLIGNDVSNAELNSRLDLAVNQVQNADPQILSTLKQFYPTVSTSGLMAYFLNPQAALPILQQQTLSAEIGTAAIKNNLTTSVSSATALAQYGVTQAQAQTGYEKIAEVLPAATKLSDIYGTQLGFNYNQATGEQQYLMNSGQAALEQQKLSLAEQAQFSGRSGLAPNVESLKKNMQGAF